jgi:hydrogenase expression/formation protein HypE
VTGDTKVVERGAADRIFLVTSGVGVVPKGREVGPSRIEPGDAVLVSGTIGDHGVALLAQREGLAFQSPVESDCAPLSGLVEALFQSGATLHAMRDPTRGGLAATLFEMAEASGITIEIEETALPVKPSVRGACEMLGLDPISIANEGKLVGVVTAGSAETALRAARGHALGSDAAIIGRAVPRRDRPLLMHTRIGGERIVEMPYGEAQPRIC